MKNKGQISLIAIVLIILFIILAVSLNIFQSASILGEQNNPEISSTRTKLISQTSESATYTFSFSVADPLKRDRDCSERIATGFNFNVNSQEDERNLPEFVDWIPEGEFRTTKVQISGIKAEFGVCGGAAGGGDVLVTETEAVCKIKKVQENKARIDCKTVKGSVTTQQKAPMQFFGLSTGTITATFLKEGDVVEVEDVEEEVDVPDVDDEGIVKPQRNIIDRIVYGIIDFFKGLFGGEV